MTIEEQNGMLAARRSNNALDTSTIEALYPDILNVEEAVEMVLKNWNKKIVQLRRDE